MLTIIVPAFEEENWDSKKEEFVSVKLERDYELKLEHSLISLHKWEAKWHKPFLSSEKTETEAVDYIRCMALNQNVPEKVIQHLTKDDVKKIQDYIENPMTATPFGKSNKRPNRRIITAELIYSWMISLNIPVEFEKWHFQSLLTLIRVCEEENTPTQQKKHSQKELVNRYAAINAANRKKFNSKG